MEHSKHILKVGDNTTCNTSSPDIYWRKQLNQQAHLELGHRNPGILGRVLNQIALSNSTATKCAPMQVIKQQECGRTSTVEELSDKLWLTANNSKSFANRSKSIIRNNLGLFKHSCKYCKISKNSFLYRTSLVAASGIKSNIIGSGPQNAGTPQNPGF